MTNPFETTVGPAFQPGESRTVSTKDGKIVFIHRTDRPYVEDLCDAYNDAMAEDARQRGLRWQIAHNGELRLGFPDEVTRANTKRIERDRETERSRFIRRQLETAQ